MKAYNELVQDLDSGGARYSQDLSEVDLTDLENLKVRVNDPAGDVLVELGSSDFLKRYKTYVSHVQEWRQQFQKLESVNLRYDNQVIVNPDMEGKPQAARAVGLRGESGGSRGRKAGGADYAHEPHENDPHDALPKPAFELTEKKARVGDAKKAAVKASVQSKSQGASSKKIAAKDSASGTKVAATTNAWQLAQTGNQKACAIRIVGGCVSIDRNRRFRNRVRRLRNSKRNTSSD